MVIIYMVVTMFNFNESITKHLESRGVSDKMISMLDSYRMEVKGNLYFEKTNVNSLISYSRLLQTRTEIENNADVLRQQIFDNSELFSLAQSTYYRMRTIKNILDDFLENNKSFQIGKYQVVEYISNVINKIPIKTISIDNESQNVVSSVDVKTTTEFDHTINRLVTINDYQSEFSTKEVTLSYILTAPTQVNKFVFSLFSHGLTLSSLKFKMSGVFIPESDYVVTIDTFKDTFVANISKNGKPIVINEIVICFKLLFNEYIDKTILYYFGIGDSYVCNDSDFTTSTSTNYELLDITKNPKLVIGENQFINRGDKCGENPFLTNIDNGGVTKINGEIIIKSLKPYSIELFPKPESDLTLTSLYSKLVLPMSDLIKGRLLYLSADVHKKLNLNIGDAVLIEYTPKESTYDTLFKRTDILKNDILECDDDKVAMFIREMFITEGAADVTWYGDEIIVNISIGEYYRELKTLTMPNGTTIPYMKTHSADPRYYGILSVKDSEDLYWYLEEEFVRGVSENTITVELEHEYMAGSIVPYVEIDQYYIRLDFDDSVTDESLGPIQSNPGNTGNRKIIIKDIPSIAHKVCVAYQPFQLDQGMDIITNLQSIYDKNMDCKFTKGVTTIKRHLANIDTTILQAWGSFDGAYTHPIAQTIIYRPFKVTDSVGNVKKIGSITFDETNINISLAEEVDEDLIVYYYSKETDVDYTISPRNTILDTNFAIILE